MLEECFLECSVQCVGVCVQGEGEVGVFVCGGVGVGCVCE